MKAKKGLPTVPGVDDVVWVKEAASLYKRAADEGWLDKLQQFVKRKHHVLLLGQTGAGKSQLLSALKDSTPRIIDAGTRTRQNEPAQSVTLANSPFRFFDTPGDDRLGDERLKAYMEQERRNRIGIVNVVSYGYHEYPSATGAIDKNGSVSEIFLELHRRLEVAQLAEWASRFGVLSRRPWVITAVTKADLWWDREPEVTDHYSNGEYNTILRSAGLSNIVVATTSTRRLFFGKPGTISPSFDDASLNEIRTELIREIISASATG